MLRFATAGVGTANTAIIAMVGNAVVHAAEGGGT